MGVPHAHLAEARQLVSLAVEQLQADPSTSLCLGSEGYAECEAARASLGAP